MRWTVKSKKHDDLTKEEMDDIKQFDAYKTKNKTKVCTLKELIKELHE